MSGNGPLAHLATFESSPEKVLKFRDDIVNVKNSRLFMLACHRMQVFPIWACQQLDLTGRNNHLYGVGRVGQELCFGAGLCPELGKAGGFAHDICQCPYGHMGENYARMSIPYFSHEAWGYWAVKYLENLNLSPETRLMILLHSMGSGVLQSRKALPEHQFVILSDKVCYTIWDSYDILKVFDSPFVTEILGISRDLVPWYHATLRKLTYFFKDSPYDTENFIIGEILDECGSVGRVSFKKSGIARDFWRLQRWLNDYVYLVVNLRREWTALNTVHNDLIKNGSKYPEIAGIDPLVALFMLTDHEIDRYSEYVLTKNHKECKFFWEYVIDFHGLELDGVMMSEIPFEAMAKIKL